MHGRPRPKKGLAEDPEKIQKQKQRALLYGKLAEAVLSRRAAKQYDRETLTLSQRLLELNPEVYTVWNYRREALADVIDGSGSEACRKAAAVELALTKKALAQNPKSYATWHHRTWAVTHGAADLQQELKLVQGLLQLDPRNFHGWAYWRWLTHKAGTPPEELLAFTDAKLQENFSNYSAWHARTHLLAAAHSPPQVQSLQQLMSGTASDTSLPSSVAVPMDVLDREFDLVHRAFYTEPTDQSAWLYHRWLLGNCMAAAGITSAGGAAAMGGGSTGGAAPAAEAGSTSPAVEALHARLQEEAHLCQQLLQMEPDAKWPLLTLTRVQELQETLEAASASSSSAAGSAATPATDAQQPGSEPTLAAAVSIKQREPSLQLPQEAASGVGDNSLRTERYMQLAELDPKRAGYYADAAAGKAHVVVRAPVAA